MNEKNKKLLAIVGVAAVLLIVIGVSVSMLGKSSQPSGTDPAAAPTDVTTEDVSQPPEEETTTPTVEVPDESRKPLRRPHRPRRNSRRPARTMSRLFPIPLPISPRTAIRRTALFTLRASAGFLTRAAVLCSTILIQMEI